MQYMLLIYHDPRHAPVQADTMELCGGLAHRLTEEGRYVAGAPLQPIETARSLRVRAGKRFVTDGPFAETREQLAGYMLVHADSPDEALEIAAEHPVAKYGTVEVRPVMELPS